MEWMTEDLGLNGFAFTDSSIPTVYEAWPIAAATPDGFVCLGEIELLEAKSTLARVKCIEDINVS
ncbi:hypothetical protein U2106_15065, partial [Listeria monocytogenes]|uniref:hypothetical protein n=1 Tax=Listeria monocytogenes TaxID=1639 RepID=UPI002FDBE72E